ncbi:MAG: putative ABC transporter permease [Clostridia bacterium]
MGAKIFEILTYFIIYSFLGWIMESIVRSVSEKKIINTGFLKGPVCPIYGIGAIIMLLFLERYQEISLSVLFYQPIIILTTWEYLVGVLLEKIFHTKYWDYSEQKFNFQGRICLVNSICWGILGVIFVKYIHPFVKDLTFKVDIKLLHYIISIIAIVLLADLIVTIIKVKNIKMTLKKVEEINKEIKAKLNEIRKLTKENNKSEEKTIKTENVRKLVEA